MEMVTPGMRFLSFSFSHWQVEPLIQKGHENLVHHILLYQCSSSLNASVLGYGHECYHPNMPDAFLTCETVMFAWAIGGEVGGRAAGMA